MMPTPTKTELTRLCLAVKSDISDEYRAFEDDDEAGIQLTVAESIKLKEWTFQTGDNSYFGPCYAYPHWAVVGVYRDSNCAELAAELINKLGEAADYASTDY